MSFATLSVALVLLNCYCTLLGSDVVFRGIRQEVAIAGFASLIQAAGAWLLISFIPAAAARVIVVPLLIVAIIYKLAHLVDWTRYHILLLFLFQFALGASAACLYYGRFGSALIIMGAAAAFLALLWAIVRDAG